MSPAATVHAWRFGIPAWRQSADGALPLLLPVLLIGLWIWATSTARVPEQILPSPHSVWLAFREVYDSGELTANLAISLHRLLSGFLLGASGGLLFGVTMALSPTVRAYFGFSFEALRQIPTLVLIPVLILVFGIGETLKIVILVKAVFFPVALAAREAVKQLPVTWLELGRVYRLRPWTSFRRIVLPAVLPPVLTGLRIALGRAWMILVAVELLAADSGIGQMIEMGRQMLRLDTVLVCVLLTAVIGGVLDLGLRGLESLLPGRSGAAS